MVRVGNWEMRLVAPGGGAAFPEARAPDGKTYAVASPGAAFDVAVTQHPDPTGAEQMLQIPGYQFLTASLKVDGISVGYNKMFFQPNTGRFEGFLKAGDAQGSAYNGFKFTKPQETEAKQATGLNFTEGSIVCEVLHGMYTGGLQAQQRWQGPGATNESVAKLPEGKKFFMAPSLTTGKGELRVGGGFDAKAWAPVTGVPLITLQLRYETAATLLLRGVLKRETPAHRAILQQFPDTAEQEGDEQENEGAAGPSRGGGGGAARGRKRRLGGPEIKPDPEAEVVDLTKAPNENDEVLKAKQQDQVLICDLLSDDEPVWRAKKKEVHRV